VGGDQAASNKPWQDLAKAEAALAIGILTFMPIRLENLTGLTIGKHLYLRSEPHSPSALEIPGSETKNGMPREFDVPPHLEQMLLEFRAAFAPRIPGHAPAAIFVNIDGSPKTKAGVRRLIVSYLKARCGIEFNPHAFRHLAGKLILDQETGEYEQVRQLLGNRRLETTIKYYVGVCTRRAGRHHQRLLEGGLGTGVRHQSRPKNLSSRSVMDS
jgi:integrase